MSKMRTNRLLGHSGLPDRSTYCIPPLNANRTHIYWTSLSAVSTDESAARSSPRCSVSMQLLIGPKRYWSHWMNHQGWHPFRIAPGSLNLYGNNASDGIDVIALAKGIVQVCRHVSPTGYRQLSDSDPHTTDTGSNIIITRVDLGFRCGNL